MDKNFVHQNSKLIYITHFLKLAISMLYLNSFFGTDMVVAEDFSGRVSPDGYGRKIEATEPSAYL